MKTSVVITLQVLIVVGFAQLGDVVADDSIRSVIDQHMQPVSGLVPAKCSDAEYLRRVSLDLIGMPPTSDEARAFLTDTAADKREKLVEELLASPHSARHLVSTLDLMLMERRANTHVTADEWQAWLLKSVRDNKPWNVLVREILLADGDDPIQRPASRFTLDRGSEPNLLTHDISRIFFGRDMQCAQCHDHPIVADYLQSDYHGLLAYIAPGYTVVKKVGDKDVTLQAERAGSDLTFESVFVKGTQHRTGARMPDDVAIEEPFFLPGEEYQVPPGDNVKSVPKFSRRAKLAELATNGSNQAFNQNIANRLWAHMFGRGLVHPLDLHHPNNPATDPELLQFLGERFAAMDYNIQSFLREIALSETYQRSFDVPGELAAAAAPAAAQLVEMQQQRPALELAAKESVDAYSAALDGWHQAEAGILPAATEFDSARNVYAEARKKLDEANKSLTDAAAQQQSKQNVSVALREAADATQRAAEALSGDTELPATAAKLRAKTELLTTEATALAKTVEEKTAAIKPLAEALDTVKPPIDVAVAKLAPLQTAMSHAEQSMLSARQKAAADSQRLAAFDSQLHTTQTVSQLPDHEEAIVKASESAKEQELELATAEQQLTESATIVAQLASAQDAINQATTEHFRREQRVTEIRDAMSVANAELVTKQTEMQSSISELEDRLVRDFTAASLKPLTPEQLCWSVFRVTGVYEQYWQTEVAELDKASPLTDEQKQDAAFMAARTIELEQKTFDKLKGNVATFVTFYGAAAGQPQGDFFSTADQALFTSNAGSINSWVAPAGNNVTQRIISQSDTRVAAEELYLGILTRMPTEDEIADVTSYLNSRVADKNVASQELVWAILNSAEFRFNH